VYDKAAGEWRLLLDGQRIAAAPRHEDFGGLYRSKLAFGTWAWTQTQFLDGLLGDLRIYGGGIASSYSESIFCLDSPSPNRVRFDLPRVMRSLYRIDDFQETYFVLDKLEDLLALAQVDFGPLYEEVARQAPLPPGQLLASDTVLTRGDGSYHQRNHS
jgi:hypothetical protein